MYELNENQVRFIEEDLLRRGIEMNSLREGILDHVCCMIENEMKDQDDFMLFYESTIKKFYKKELSEIERETKMLLTYKNYYTMKKTMKISGLISSIGFILGGLLKFLHLPGASVMLIFGFGSFALFFLPMMILLKFNEQKNYLNKVTMLLGLVAGSGSVLGTLFKIMHWPYANIMMNSSFVIFISLFIPIYFFSGIRDKEKKLNVIVNTVLFISVAGILFSMYNLTGSRNFNASNIQADQFLLKNLDLIKDKKTIRVDSSKDEKKLAIENAIKLTDYVIEQIRIQSGDSGKPASFEDISLNNSFEVSGNVLFHMPAEEKDAYIYQLRAAYNKVDNYIPERSNKIIRDDLLNTNGENEKWENIFFRNNTVSISVRKLNLIKLKLELMILN
ncbi:MAG: hypothetical protein ACK5D5_07390 [Bacteroidota bacterium]|jgi:hypothetical protein